MLKSQNRCTIHTLLYFFERTIVKEEVSANQRSADFLACSLSLVFFLPPSLSRTLSFRVSVYLQEAAQEHHDSAVAARGLSIWGVRVCSKEFVVRSTCTRTYTHIYV